MRTLIKTITKKDFKIDFLKTGGPGGQRRNKVETAVRITHRESGLSCVADSERSQSKNKQMAFKRLVSKLDPWLREKYAPGIPRQKVDVVIRNYNKKRNTVVDIRLIDKTFDFDAVLYGSDLHQIILELGDAV